MDSTAASGEFSKTYVQLGKALAPFTFVPTELLASYPRILEGIEHAWGTAEACKLLDGYLLSERADRQGFSVEVVEELTFIKNVFDVSFSKLSADPNDPFSQASIREIERRQSAARDQSDRDKAEAERKLEAPKKAGRERTGIGADGDMRSLDLLAAALKVYERGSVALGKAHRLLGEILVADGVVEASALSRALKMQELEIGRRRLLGEILVATGSAKRSDIMRGLSKQRGLPLLDVASIKVAAEVIKLVPLRVAQVKFVVPVALVERRLVIATENPFDQELENFFSFLTGHRVVLVYSPKERILAALAGYGQGRQDERVSDRRRTGAGAATAAEGGDEGGVDDDAPEIPASVVDENDESVIGLVNKAINDAIRLGASDVHFEAFPKSKHAQARLRRDGVMAFHMEYPAGYHPAVVSRVKILASLDISEKRHAQDGKVSFAGQGRKVDLRVSSIPTTGGIENVTIRLLTAGRPIALSKIGMHPTTHRQFAAEIAKPYGLILVCGPTGSGKTTTLHSVLHELNTPERKIWTAEDPVEITQKNINQVQVNAKIGWTFAHALRAFLRADPDVIMIGEIRDGETARIAVEASMTGHLVLSTLHTNSSAETLARIVDLGVAPFNLADSVLAILAQRLARRVCPDCAERRALSADEAGALAEEYLMSAGAASASKNERERLVARWRQEFGEDGELSCAVAAGCAACNGSGYRGRLGIHELLAVSPPIRTLIRAGSATGEVFRQAIASGMKTLRQDGIEKVVQGLTDMREVRTVCL